MPGGGRAAQFDEQAVFVLDQFGLLDHHHGIGAARQHAAGRDRAGGAGRHLDLRRVPAGDHFGVETQFQRRGFARLGNVFRAQCEAVDAGAVERRHIERRRDVMRQRAAERGIERNGFRAGRATDRRCAAKRFCASSGDTTSRNCSCRAALRTAASKSDSALSFALMAADSH